MPHNMQKLSDKQQGMKYVGIAYGAQTVEVTTKSVQATRWRRLSGKVSCQP